MGHQLEPGTVVVGSIYLTHRRQDLYPEPVQAKRRGVTLGPAGVVHMVLTGRRMPQQKAEPVANLSRI